MTLLPTINRRHWLLLDLQRRRRARRAPVLSPLYPGMLAWEWPYPNPHKWQVWMSGDGGVTWSLVNDYWAWGDARQFSPDGSWQRYSIVGVNEAGVAVTGRSCEVVPDDAVAPSAPVALLNGLWAHWRLDESDGWVRSDSVGGAHLSEWDGYDISPFVGCDVGMLGSSAWFTTWEGTWKGLRATACYGMDTTVDFSVAGWVKYFPNASSIERLFELGSTMRLSVDPTNSALVFEVLTVNGAEEQAWEQCVSGFESVPNGGWVHCAVVKEAGVLKVYVNGALAETWSLANGVIYEPNFDLLLGVSATDPSVGLDGWMDDWGLWSRALSAAEVGALYNGGAGLFFESYTS